MLNKVLMALSVYRSVVVWDNLSGGETDLNRMMILCCPTGTEIKSSCACKRLAH